MTDWNFDYNKRTHTDDPTDDAVLIGEYMRGDMLGGTENDSLRFRDGQVLWPFASDGKTSPTFGQPIAMLGRPGTGKSLTAWTFSDRLAHADPDSQHIIIDANADFLGFGRRFGASMAATGRTPFFFPHQRLDGWPGDDWLPIYNRILEIIPFAEKEAAAFYTDASSVALQLACRIGGGPPRSTTELFERLNYDLLLDTAGPEELEGVTKAHVKALRMRCKSACSHFGSAFDGDLSFADIDAGYFGIDALVLSKSAVVVMRKLLSQLSYYIEHEKDPDRRMLIVIDEFAALDGHIDIGAFVEHARKLGVCVIVMSQTVPGFGGSAQIARILDNAGLVLVHATAEWNAIAHLIGRQIAPEVTLADEPEGEADLDRLRLLEKAKVSPDDLLGLPVGQLVALRRNLATLLRIKPPDTSGYEPFELPEREELFEPLGSFSGSPAPRKPRWIDMEPRRFRGADFEIPEGVGEEPSTSDADGEPTDGADGRQGDRDRGD